MISKVLQRRFISMFNTAVEGLWIMTPDGKLSYYNHSFYQQFDISIENATLEDWINLIHPEDRIQFDERVDEHLNEEEKSSERVYSQYRVLKKDGNYCWIEAVGVMQEDADGEFMVGNHRDISEQKVLESSIRRLAYFDQSTGLPNSDQLKIDLENRHSNVTLFSIHLDGIRSFINQYGTDSVKEIVNSIIECSEIFSSFNSKFYRTDIDTFAVLLTSEVTEQYLAKLCQKFISKFTSISTGSGVLYAGRVFVGAFPCSDKGLSPESIIAWADQTAEYALRHEPAHWAVCNASIQIKVERYFYIERNLKSAIENDEISIRFQPIVCSSTNQIRSFEALARWEKSEIGEIYPDEFIPAAERKSLISALGEKVFAQAASFIAYYDKIWNCSIKINVNISVLQLLASDFPQQLIRIAQEEGARPESIVIELTESVLLEGQHQAMTQLRELDKAGFELAMDDFGSGHSSVTGFFKLPFNCLKIDRELANESMKEIEPLAYLEFLTMLCSMKGIKVTVEGIESTEMVEKFTNMDVTHFQGYFYSRPMTLENALSIKPSTVFPI
ncbi:EAL domain-containing protein [Vibrio hannami]|nr:EAL domain-containing protein [Vibrio hannami]MDG3084878.1 EAL domain-containing protein [Vibrio hannami]